jgi:hypothetical protein
MNGLQVLKKLKMIQNSVIIITIWHDWGGCGGNEGRALTLQSLFLQII